MIKLNNVYSMNVCSINEIWTYIFILLALSCDPHHQLPCLTEFPVAFIDCTLWNLICNMSSMYFSPTVLWILQIFTCNSFHILFLRNSIFGHRNLFYYYFHFILIKDHIIINTMVVQMLHLNVFFTSLFITKSIFLPRPIGRRAENGHFLCNSVWCFQWQRNHTQFTFRIANKLSLCISLCLFGHLYEFETSLCVMWL